MKSQLIYYDAKEFNNLPTIEDADEFVRVSGKLEKALDILGPIFIKYRMHNSWGLSLLHNHFKIEDFEIPIQEKGVEDGLAKFTTRPHRNHDALEISPAIIRFDGEKNIIPLEYSNDSSAVVANKELQNSPDFVNELYEIMTKEDLINYFGLIYGKSIKQSYELVEFNYLERVSVLKEISPFDIVGMGLTETSWFFSADQESGKCKSKCLAKCNTGTHTPSHSAYHDPNG